MNVIDLLRERARTSPDQPYLIFADKTCSFGAVYWNSQRRATELVGQGVQPGCSVALIASRTAAAVETMFALLDIGAVVIPLDIDEPEDRVAALLARVAPDFAVVDAIRSHLRWPANTRPIALATAPVANNDRSADLALRSDSASHASHVMSGDETAFTFFTTGSTGEPKGIELSHRAVISGQQWLQRAIPLTQTDRQLFRTTLGVTNLLRETIWPVVAGCGTCVLPVGLHADVGAHLEAVEMGGVTVIGGVPILVDAMLTQSASGHAMRGLRHVICTSDTFLGAQYRRFQDALPDTTFYNVYGQTEAPYIAYRKCTAVDRERVTVPIGVEADLSMHILNDALQPVVAGETGRVYVGGVGMISRYRANETLSASRIVTIDGQRLFDTGDRGVREADGLIHLIGRSEYLVKIGGYRVDVADVEATLQSLENVQRACVLPFEIGGGVRRLAAWLEAVPGAALDEKQVRASLAQRLPVYMLPARIGFVAAFPMMHNGKVDKAALEARGAGQPADVLAGAGIDARDGSGSPLLSIIRDVLTVSRLDIERNIVELGGDSISAFLISVRAHEIGIDLTPSMLLSTPIAQVLQQRQWTRAAPLASIGARPLAPRDELSAYGWSPTEIDTLLTTLQGQQA